MKAILFIIIITLCGNQLLAQCPNRIIGIYKSKSDFGNRILSYPSQCKSAAKNKIHLNDLFKAKYISIHNNGNKIKIAKDSIFAFLKGDGSIYRLQKNEAFIVLDTTTAVILYHMNLPQKQTGKINVTRYAYSIGFSGEIKKLSITNLLNDFASDVTFCISVKAAFNYNTELVEIDSETKTYKILKLIKSSKSFLNP